MIPRTRCAELDPALVLVESDLHQRGEVHHSTPEGHAHRAEGLDRDARESTELSIGDRDDAELYREQRTATHIHEYETLKLIKGLRGE